MKALGTWRFGRVSFLECLKQFSLSEFPKIAFLFLYSYFFVLEYTGPSHGMDSVGDILDASRPHIYILIRI